MHSTHAQLLLTLALSERLKMLFMAEFSTLGAIKATRVLSTIHSKEQDQILMALRYGYHPQGRIRSLLPDSALQSALQTLGSQPSLLRRDDISVRDIVDTLTMVHLPDNGIFAREVTDF